MTTTPGPSLHPDVSRAGRRGDLFVQIYNRTQVTGHFCASQAKKKHSPTGNECGFLIPIQTLSKSA